MIRRTDPTENKMELLAPAGSMKQLISALRFGADAVYGGLEEFSLRAGADNFTWDSLPQALLSVHGQGARFYLTLNLLPYDEDLPRMAQAAARAFEMGIDGALVADPGAFAAIRQAAPELPLYVSTQANVMNLSGALCWVKAGAKRIVLARELSLDRIRRIREGLPGDVELEAFVHGAMCMSYSGRCMLSDHMTGRGANRGACAQPCRWQYHLVEEKRPGQIIDVAEDERGTAFFSSYDLNMIAHLPEMREAGIRSLKIEGRMKTPLYAATAVSCYRKALDLLETQGEDAYRQALPQLSAELEKIGHRPYNTGFYFGRPAPEGGAGPVRQTMEYTADVVNAKDGWLTLLVKNRFFVGDTVEIVMPGGCQELLIREIRDAGTDESMDVVSVPGRLVRVPCPFPAQEGDFVRGINRNHREQGL